MDNQTEPSCFRNQSSYKLWYKMLVL